MAGPTQTLILVAILIAILVALGIRAHGAAAVSDGQIVTIRRPATTTMTRQQLPAFVGISGASAGATAISMNRIVIPPGGAAAPHLHRGYETAIYIVEGRVETRYGAGLRRSTVNEAGDFIFIPADVPHQPVNLSKTQAAQAIVARSDPNEQESVEPYDPAALH